MKFILHRRGWISLLLQFGSLCVLMKCSNVDKHPVEKITSCPSIKNFDRYSNDTVRMAILLPNRTDIPACLQKIMPAIDIAIAKIQKDNLLPGWTFHHKTYNSNCSNVNAPYEAVRAYMEERIHVFFGPVCDLAAAVVGRFLRYWNVPLLTAGAYAHDYGRNKTVYESEFYLLTRTGLSFNSVSKFLFKVLDEFKWRKLMFIYDNKAFFMDQFCYYVGSAIVEDFNLRPNYTYGTYNLDKDKSLGLKENLKREIGYSYGGKLCLLLYKVLFIDLRC